MDPTTTSHRESGDARREAIAGATRALIAEKGFEGLRTRDIAERVGINIATLHYHVPTKDALIALVVESMRSEFVGQHFVRPRAHLSARERLAHEFTDFWEIFADKPEIFAVLAEMAGRARRDETVNAAMTAMITKWRAIYAGVVRDGQEDGTFRADIDPEAAAEIAIGAMIGFGRFPEPSAERFARLSAELTRALLHPPEESDQPQQEH